jgi:hypothetical protein
LQCSLSCPAGFSCSNGTCVGSANPIVFDERAFTVSYRVTLNGLTPVTNCTGSSNKVRVSFRDIDSGWTHSDSIYCSNANFTFNTVLPKGTYSVWVTPESTATNIPAGSSGEAWRVLKALAVTGDVSNLQLDVSTASVGYRVTLNGLTPVTSCTGSSNKVRVSFREADTGWTHADSIYCSNANFTFNTVLPKGTYSAWVTPESTATNIPAGSSGEPWRVLASVVVSADVTNLQLDVATVFVAYVLKLNGSTPATTCTGSLTKVRVSFREVETGWTHTDAIYCSNTNFTFSTTLPKGTWSVSAAPEPSGTNLVSGDTGSGVPLLTRIQLG